MKSIFASVICWLFTVHQGFAAPERVPPDVFKAQEDGYLYADYPGVFDDAEGDGITIEVWIYLTERPKNADYRRTSRGGGLVFAKPGSYFVRMHGRDASSDPDLPEGTVLLEFGTQGQPNPLGWGSQSIASPRILPEDFPFRRWVHIAFQLVVKNVAPATLCFMTSHA